MLVALVLSGMVPLWFNTMHVYRAELPWDDIAAWDRSVRFPLRM
jgi:hypothetical protein